MTCLLLWCSWKTSIVVNNQHIKYDIQVYPLIRIGHRIQTKQAQYEPPSFVHLKSVKNCLMQQYTKYIFKSRVYLEQSAFILTKYWIQKNSKIR